MSDGELNKIVDFIKKQSIPVEYSEEVTQQVLESDTKGSNAASENGNDLMSDELLKMQSVSHGYWSGIFFNAAA